MSSLQLHTVPTGRPTSESQITSRWESAGRVNWFNQNGAGAGGGAGLVSNTDGSTSTNTPPSGHYYAEKPYLDTSGETGGSTKDNGFRMQFNTSVGNNYWLAARVGKPTLSYNDAYGMSPIWCPGMCGVAFKWQMVDNGSSDKHRLRVHKMGLTVCTTSGTRVHDMVKVGGSDAWKSYSAGIRNGWSVMELPSSFNTRGIPVGMHFQLQTEGGFGTASGSRFVVYQLTPVFKSTSVPTSAVLPMKEFSAHYVKENQNSMYGYTQLTF